MKKLFILTILLISQFSGAALDMCVEGNCVNGQGTKIEANGDKYVGEWEDGKQHGKGKRIYRNGKVDEGTWSKGRLIRATNTSAKCIKGNCVNGYGTFTSASGRKYVGEWKNGKYHGQGSLTYFDGAKYVGQWKELKKHGLGTYTWANGNQYVGQWKNGKSNGLGTYTWANGSKYAGDFVNGLRTGKGKYTWAKSGSYEGDFIDGKITGKGKRIYASGKVDEGTWQNGILIAENKTTSSQKQKTKNKTSNNSNNPAYDECMKLVRKEERELQQQRVIVGILSLNKNNNVRKAYSDIKKEEKEIRRMKQQCICYLNKSGNCSTIYLDKDISIGIN